MVLTQKRTHRSMEQNGKPRNGLTWYGQLIFNKAGRKTVPSTSGIGKLYVFMQKNETGPLCETIHENIFKVDERPTHEIGNH